ncbi:MAG: hypothetical protein ACJATV_001544 [Granulosicoccus sp.]|jgi:hypothetical protein
MTQTINKQQWLDWINEQEHRGLSIAAFCRDKAINADSFYYHRGQHRKKMLPENSSFVRAQFISEPAVTELDSIRVTYGDVIIYLPLDKPLQTAQLIKALQ